MPANLTTKPQTTRQAKRAYQKSNKRYEFTATQYRKAERLDLLEQRAKKAKEKEQRAKDNKRKREEKEEKERETKKRLVADGKIQPESLWGNVRASQPRLNTFLMKKKATGAVSEIKQVAEEAQFQADSKKVTLSDDVMHQAQPTEEFSDQDMLEFFSSPTANVDHQSTAMVRPAVNKQLQSYVSPQLHPSSRISDPQIASDQALFDAQFSLPDSVGDFVIAEDDSADHESIQPEALPVNTPSHQRHLPATILAHVPTTPSPLKRKRSDLDVGTPSMSARSALSEMSPSKVNIRTQEKPDPTSSKPTLGSWSNLQQDCETSNQVVHDTLALISTQDLQDDEFAENKENEIPRDLKMSAKCEKNGFSNSSENSEGKATPFSEKMRKSCDSDHYSEHDDLFDLDDSLEDFDTEIEDDFFAGLSTQIPAKNTAVTEQGSPRKAKAMPPPSLKPKFVEAKQMVEKSTSTGRSALKKVDSFAFDGVDDQDLAEFAEALEMSSLPKPSRRGRLIPWQQAPSSPMSQSLATALTSSPEEFPNCN